MSPCPAQVARIMAVMNAAFDPAYGEAWNTRQVSDALTMPTTHAIVVDAAGRRLTQPGEEAVPAGFVMTRQGADEEELLLIAVRPDCRERGLAQELIAKAFADARSRGVRRMFLEMRQDNPAEHLYRKVGFEPIGRRPKYYRLSNGLRVDAITFGRTL
ncbi:GNAT family N-acetyltransferase [Qipengyuania nanhaisediminis]|uniref:GNAT family N-acetyltransferase n=1 Tax=Qipengyuania nanhaisediminis TaxID=604088 RepID=UPI0038B31011